LSLGAGPPDGREKIGSPLKVVKIYRRRRKSEYNAIKRLIVVLPEEETGLATKLPNRRYCLAVWFMSRCVVHASALGAVTT
jgi:hypothetical protein